ncbi:MAG: HK97 gp10 family phage protein [Burkholderiales bacterium]|jgi:HK97 gp10 family phage protein|nr:HK97 gp10 family phage protein [Burkholderiales bacterium]
MARKLIELAHDLQGLAELEKGLRELGRDVGLKGLSKATSAGARLIRDRARALAPKDTGKLKNNIVVTKYRRVRDKDRETRHAVVIRQKGKASDKQNAFYGAFVECGTSKQAAQPFIRPAFEGKRKDAANTVVRSMEKTIATEKVKRGFK